MYISCGLPKTVTLVEFWYGSRFPSTTNSHLKWSSSSTLTELMMREKSLVILYKPESYPGPPFSQKPLTWLYEIRISLKGTPLYQSTNSTSPSPSKWQGSRPRDPFCRMTSGSVVTVGPGVSSEPRVLLKYKRYVIEIKAAIYIQSF